jgi:hypothetical protein
MLEKDQLFYILDIIISEYGWDVDYCMKIPHDVLMGFYHAILARKHREDYLHTKLTGLAVNAGFSGKLENIDKVFKKDTEVNEPVDEDAWKNQLRSLWARLGKDLKEFDEKWERGENISL